MIIGIFAFYDAAAFVILPVLSEITIGYLDYRMPFDIMINNTSQYIDRMQDIPQIDFSFVREILSGHGIALSEEVIQENYFVWERDFNTPATRDNWHDQPRLAMRISDYNAMREMAGFEPVNLGEKEFFMHLDYEMEKETVAAGITSTAISLDDGTVLGLHEQPVYNEPLGQYLFQMGVEKK